MNVRRVSGLALIGAAAVLLAGCTADEPSRSTVGPARDFAGEAAPAPDGGAKGRPGGAPPLSAAGVADQRSVVRTATVTVRVDGAGVGAAADRAIAAARAAGGYAGGDSRSHAGAASRATVTLRVPAARFDELLDRVAGVGREEHREIGTEDVSEEVVDVDARLASQRASVDRTRALLARARSVGELVSIEGELARREAELAALQARQRRLADRTALATITLELRGTAARPDEPGAPGFLAGLGAGWRALLASLGVLATVLGAVAPWLLVLGVPIWLLVVLLLRRRARRTALPPATADPQPATPATPAAATAPVATPAAAAVPPAAPVRSAAAAPEGAPAPGADAPPAG
ncbi:hypothetical protein GCM10010123_23530 [Pilimelia anulata]|uniref:DUF4349 domain-containing protein n=1 Tax=Pilimelia anulata TaxID=53371 RepID=A0A8J3B3F3_9ACTN|nr:DUF4349 domain-containing protein [Pilimelia anulata]GGJ92958.1 hypothetical protein GCM10010123_23530 [Pilimelia anulata]